MMTDSDTSPALSASRFLLSKTSHPRVFGWSLERSPTRNGVAVRPLNVAPSWRQMPACRNPPAVAGAPRLRPARARHVATKSPFESSSTTTTPRGRLPASTAACTSFASCSTFTTNVATARATSSGSAFLIVIVVPHEPPGTSRPIATSVLGPMHSAAFANAVAKSDIGLASSRRQDRATQFRVASAACLPKVTRCAVSAAVSGSQAPTLPTSSMSGIRVGSADFLSKYLGSPAARWTFSSASDVSSSASLRRSEITRLSSATARWSSSYPSATVHGTRFIPLCFPFPNTRPLARYFRATSLAPPTEPGTPGSTWRSSTPGRPLRSTPEPSALYATVPTVVQHTAATVELDCLYGAFAFSGLVAGSPDEGYGPCGRRTRRQGRGRAPARGTGPHHRRDHAHRP